MGVHNDNGRPEQYQRWEYNQFSINFRGATNAPVYVMDRLNRLGDDGWELVSAEYMQYTVVFLLKRPKE